VGTPSQTLVYKYVPRHSVLTIVMGARPNDYARAAPYKSYIYVDQFSGPRDLAQFLLQLDKDARNIINTFRYFFFILLGTMIPKTNVSK
jgi:hypothetical protein